MIERVFAALADPTRRQLLELLAEGEQPVAVLVDGLAATRPVSQPAVSQHLKVLRDSGLVSVRREGTRRLHRVEPAGLVEASRWLERLAEAPGPFGPSLDALETEVARGRRQRSGATEPGTRRQAG